MMVGMLGGIIATLLVGIGVWLLVAYTGAYNVAASQQHFDPVRWTLDTTRDRSIASRAGGADIPESPSREMLSQGAAHYDESCAYCHGSPGEEPADWSRGMRPEPPHLTEAAAEWSQQEIHWIVTNGIRMTGMPAFGPHHDEEDIVAIAAFVSALPGLAQDDYATLLGGAQGQSAQAGKSPARGRQEAPPEADAEPENQ
jgi:mono/diheme cytochrome c family protein